MPRKNFTAVKAKSKGGGSSFTQDRVGNKSLQVKVRKGTTKLPKVTNDPYADLESHTSLDIDPMSMITGKIFDVDTQIDMDKKIDPADVFQNYKEPSKNKINKRDKEKKEKKIRRVDKKSIDKSFTIKYGI